MKMKRKSLMAAVALTLALGMHGNAWAADSLYGAETGNPDATNITVNAKGVTTAISSAIAAGVSYKVIGSEFDFVYGGYANATYNVDENLTNNTVAITSGTGTTTINNAVYGAWSKGTGDLSNNTVFVSGNNTAIWGSVYGCVSENSGDNVGAVSGNKVTISAGLINKVVAGAKSVSGAATGNEVTISGGTIGADGDKEVYGGFSTQNISSRNKVIIRGGTTNNFVKGGESTYNTASENSVEISGSSTLITRNVIGGCSLTGNAVKNTVTISDGSIGSDSDKACVYGGVAENKGDHSGNIVGGNANENTVTITGGEITDKVYGGYSTSDNKGGSAKSGNANKNTVDISGGTVGGNVYGGYSVAYSSSGGTAESGDANNNTVTISSGAINGVVMGGYSAANASGDGTAICGSTNNNTVTISGSDTKIKGNLCGGYSKTGEANGNSVTFKSGTLNCNFLVAGDASTLAKGNTLTIEDGKVHSDYVLAGHATTLSEGNTLEIKGGTVSATRISATNTAEVAKDNKVIISGGTVSGAVCAALADNPHWSKLEAQDNKMAISGTADVSDALLYGFNIDENFSKGGHDLLLDKYVGKTIYSIKNFEKLDFNESYNIQVSSVVDLSNAYQGNSVVDITIADIFGTMGTDTKLNILTADSIKGIAKYNLNGSEVKDGDSLASTDTSGSNGVVVTDCTFNANSQEISISLGDKFLTGKYVDNAGTATEKALVLDSGAAAYENIYGAYNAKNEATAAEVTFDSAVNLPSNTILGNNVSATGNTLNVNVVGNTVGNIKNFDTMNFVLPSDVANGDTMLTVSNALDMTDVKTVSVDGSAAANLHEGDTVDLISASGISNYSANATMDSTLTVKNSTVEQTGNVLRLTVNSEKPKEDVAKAPVEAIAAAAALVNNGGDMAAGTLMGSLVEVKGANVNGESGIFAGMSGSKNKLKTGSHVDSNDWGIGVGIGFATDHEKNPANVGVFVEYGKSDFDTFNGDLKGSGKASFCGAGLLGRVNNHSGNYYEGGVRVGRATTEWANADAGKFDDDATYFGIHAGMGHKVNVGKVQSLDVYGKYFFTHLGSMEGELKGASYDFGGVDTHRVRLGGRLEYDLHSGAQPYFGLAYEHTFNGDANATMHFGSQSANPGTPSLKGNTGILEAGCKWIGSKVDLSAGVEGYTGVRKGISGSVNVNWKF